MADPFKRPSPIPYETYESYFIRLSDEFERWANHRIEDAIEEIEERLKGNPVA